MPHHTRILADAHTPALDAAKFTYVFHIPGGYVNDHCLLRAQDLWHLFFIQGEVLPGQPWSRPGNEVRIGHATSPDLRTWTLHEPALSVTDESPLEAGHIYAPNVIEHEGTYHMFYAGTPGHSRAWFARFGNAAATGPVSLTADYSDLAGEYMFLATSTDLWQWARYPKRPILFSNPQYATYTEYGCFGCRDPHVLRHPQYGFIIYYVVGLNHKAVKPYWSEYNGIAAATSPNLIDWEDRGPVLIRRSFCYEAMAYSRPESPCVIRRGDLYYLFWKGGDGTRYVISDDPFDFQNREAYWLATSHASEIFEWDGDWYITSCSRPVEDVAHMQDRTRGLYLARLEWDGIWPRLVAL